VGCIGRENGGKPVVFLALVKPVRGGFEFALSVSGRLDTRFGFDRVVVEGCIGANVGEVTSFVGSREGKAL
jgi:hypothetical protein